MSTARTSHRRSVISEKVAPWSDIARLLRGGEADTLIPVIIPATGAACGGCCRCGSVSTPCSWA